jgi:mono/diheme cytochrome c family protein
VRLTRARLALFVGALALTLVALRSGVATAQANAQDIARGRYVFGATGGCGCHTAKGQPVNAGGRRYDGPFGTVYSSNITPDRETGIGGWTDEQIITATRLGRRPNGERLLQCIPIPSSTGWRPTT